MNVKELLKWLVDNKVPANAEIVLVHPGGNDDLIFEEYNEKYNIVYAQGTG